MKFSRKIDYGIILLKALTPTFSSGEFWAISKIAKQSKISQVFLEKLAEVLRERGYLQARRGSKGGYRLRKNPRKINLLDIIETFEESSLMRCLCPTAKKRCVLSSTCPARRNWRKLNKTIKNIFKKTALTDL